MIHAVLSECFNGIEIHLQLYFFRDSYYLALLKLCPVSSAFLVGQAIGREMAYTARRSRMQVRLPNLHLFTRNPENQVDRDFIEPLGRYVDGAGKLIAPMIAAEHHQFGRIKRLAPQTDAVDTLIAQKNT